MSEAKNPKRMEVEQFLNEVLTQALSRSKTEGLDRVQVWLESIDEERGIVKLGLSLGEGLGCSPFCSCAARQIILAIEELMKQHLPWVRKVHGTASVPKEQGLL